MRGERLGGSTQRKVVHVRNRENKFLTDRLNDPVSQKKTTLVSPNRPSPEKLYNVHVMEIIRG
jgi:hypothetical protein